MPAKPNRLKLLLPIVILLVAAGATFVWLQQKRKPQEVVLSGSLEARTVNVGSLYGGRVVRVFVDEGTHVAAGQPIVTLETETIDRQLAEQRAAIEVANANLQKGLAGSRPEEIAKAAAIAANKEKDRQQMASLYRYGIVAHQLLDDAATEAKTAADDLRLLQKGTRPEEIAQLSAQVEQQQRRLETLMKQRAETHVKASVAGVVQSFGLRPGDLVAPNQSVAEILEADQLWVRVYVPETMLGLVHVGQAVRARIDTFPNETFPGHIATISSEGEYTPKNVQTRAQRAEQVFGVKVIVDSNPKLKPGMAAEVDLGVKGRP